MNPLPSKISIQQLFVATILLYALLIGATFNGLLIPEVQFLSLSLVGALVFLWLLFRIRQGWRWHWSIYHWGWIVWGIVLIASVVPNMETWRRSAIAIWYITGYFFIWIMVYDLITNQWLQKRQLTSAVMLAGIPIVLFGYMQLIVAILQPEVGNLPRPTSTFGNANSLATFLIILIPILLAQIRTHRQRRTALFIYLLASLVLLFLTFSRGAWLGFGASFIVTIGLFLSDARKSFWGDLLQTVRSSWSTKAMAVIIICVLIAGAIVASVLFVDSFSIAGRSLDLRTYLWDSAIAQFEDNPLIGQGIFTYGHDLALTGSMPPRQPQSHAHNVLLHIAAELGLVGLLLSFLTILVLIRTIYHCWQNRTPEMTQLYVGSISGVVGVGVHHLFDVTMMMPAIMFLLLLIFLVVLVPQNFSHLQDGRFRSLAWISIFVLSLVWLLIGFSSHRIYGQYVGILREVDQTSNHLEGAHKLQEVIDADPSMPVYQLQRAVLLGVAAHDDSQFTSEAVDAYQVFLNLEPFHAISWANLASLYWQGGDANNAILAMTQAVELAPQSELFLARLTQYKGGEIDMDVKIDVSFPRGVNYARAEFLRDMLTIQVLPQLGFIEGDTAEG